MDRQPSKPTDVEILIQASQASRQLLSREIAGLKHRLDVPARVRESLTREPATWVLGSVVSGLFASLLFRRPKTVAQKSRSFSRKLLGLTLTAAQPIIKASLSGWLKELAINAINRTPPAPHSPLTPVQDSHQSNVRAPGSRSR